MRDRLLLWRQAREHLPTVDCTPDRDPQAVMVVTEHGPVPMATADNPRARAATGWLYWRLSAARIVPDSSRPNTSVYLAELDGTPATDPFHPKWELAQLVLHAALAGYEGRHQVEYRCRMELAERTLRT